MAGSSSEHGLSSRKYDVFISFRGADTRNNFVSHMYKELCRKKIEAYKDDEKLPKGDEISPSLLEAIDSSKISIVVLSENYATSSWCLDELVHILNCKRERDQIVLPVFYGVNPSDVRHQKESYTSAFVKHEKRFKDDMEKVRKWRFALEEIGNLSGWDTNENRPESELMDEIAHDILLKLQKLSSTVGNEVFRNLVGMEERFKNFELLLRMDSPEVRVIGIWGMGGIGKSTLAEIVLKQLGYKFDSCFCEDVSNEVKRHGLPNISKKLYASLLNENDVNMNNSFNDVRLRRTKVLVILDNVDDEEQLEKLIGVWEETKTRFGEGSRIIITSRDNKLLKERTDEIYEVRALDSDEANELFSQNAFRRDSSKTTDYRDLSKRIVDYAGGIPLALKVLGSYLRSRPLEEWESALSELMKSPNKKVQEVLKISYDALDLAKQSIFLGIACLLTGEDRKLVEDILGDDAHIAISVLIERSLITIDRGKIRMHDLIQEMGREVVRQESVELGKRSWLGDQDAYFVLKRNKGSASVKGMCLDLSKISNDLCLRSTVFEDLENLIFLKIYGRLKEHKLLYFDEGLDYLPDSLRYLQWIKYPLKSLPSAFEPQNLVKLNMRKSKLEKLWNGVQHLGNLKHIDLGFSHDLIELPDLSRAPRLEYVDLIMCKRLCRFPKISRNLQYLDMKYTGVEVFDPSLESAENLEFMNLGHCERLKSLPMLPRNVRKLHLEDCKSILIVSAWPVLHGLHSLTELTMRRCGISDIPESFSLLSSLEELDMRGNDFERIPSSIKQMKKLEVLDVSYCKNLESLPDLPSSLKSLGLSGCESLRMISVCGLTSVEWIDASECKSLEEFIIDEHGCMSLEEVINGVRFYFENCLKLKQGSQDNICTLFQRQTFLMEIAFCPRFRHERFSGHNWAYYCGNEIPKWFTCESEGSSIHSVGHNVIGISVSVVHELEGPEIFYNSVKPHLRIWSGAIKLMDCCFPEVSFNFGGERLRPHVYMWHSYFDSVEELPDSVTEALFEFKLTDDDSGAEIKIKKMGIRLIYLEEFEECNFSWQKADQTSPKPDEASYSRRFKRKREEYGTDADTGTTTSSPADAEEASSIGC